MQTERIDVDPGAVPGYRPPTVDRVVTQESVSPYTATGRLVGAAAVSDVGENVLTVRNRVQWGPIVAGITIGLMTMLVMSVLALAIGASALDRNTDLTDWGTAAGLWGAATILISFFLGGWVAAKTAAVDGPGSGIMNGVVTGSATLLLLIWLTTAGLTGLVGFLGTNVANLAAAVPDSVITQVAEEAPAAADQADEAVANADDAVQAAARGAADETAAGAWGTAIAMLVALVAAALGGLVGHNKRYELVAGTG